MNLHDIKSSQLMVVERDWHVKRDYLKHSESTVVEPAGEEVFECECGETFDNKSEAEEHVRRVRS